MTEIPCGAALVLEEMSRTRFNQGLWREAGASAALCLPLSAGEDKRVIIVNSCNAKQFIRVTVNYRVSCIPFSLLFNSSNDQYNPSGVTVIYFFYGSLAPLDGLGWYSVAFIYIFPSHAYA